MLCSLYNGIMHWILSAQQMLHIVDFADLRVLHITNLALSLPVYSLLATDGNGQRAVVEWGAKRKDMAQPLLEATWQTIPRSFAAQNMINHGRVSRSRHMQHSSHS